MAFPTLGAPRGMLARVVAFILAPLLAATGTAAVGAAAAPHRDLEATVEPETTLHRVSRARFLQWPVKHRRLTNDQLKEINSIACLKLKQKNSRASCEDLGKEKEEKPVAKPVEEVKKPAERGPFNIGNWPSWQDEVCNSNGAYLCDPDNLLSSEAQQKVAASLESIRKSVTVTCGKLEAKLDATEDDGSERTPCDQAQAATKSFKRPFNLGVIVASEWEKGEADPDALQQFGHVVMSQWGLMPIWNGVDTRNDNDPPFHWNEYVSNCPNAALLIILPKYDQVFLSSPSCEFICSERGGPEVGTRVKHMMDVGMGLEKAVEVGVAEIRRVLENAQVPLSLEPPGSLKERQTLQAEMKLHDEALSSEGFISNVQRAFLTGLVVAIVFSVLSFTWFNCIPNNAGERLQRLIKQEK